MIITYITFSPTMKCYLIPAIDSDTWHKIGLTVPLVNHCWTSLIAWEVVHTVHLMVLARVAVHSTVLTRVALR